MSESIFYFLQQVANGLTIGSTYALIAIGYTMVYGIIGMINFAHGEVYMISTYVVFIALAGLSMMGIDNPFILIGLALAVSIMVASAYGFSIERVAYRPLRGSKRLIALISAIGMSIFLQNYIRLAQGSRDIAMPSMIQGGFLLGNPEGSHIMISYMQVIIMVTTVLCMIALTLFITRSRMGRAC